MNAQIKKRQTVISPEQTEVRTVVPPEVPHDTRICVEVLVDKEIKQLRECKTRVSTSDMENLYTETETDRTCRRNYLPLGS